MFCNEKKISLIALCFNHGSYLHELFSSIENNCQHIGQLLIIDNGSSDDTVAKILGFQSKVKDRLEIKFFRNAAGTSVTVAVNEALKYAKKEYVAVTSGDDFLLPSRYVSQIALLDEDRNLKFVYANGVECDEFGVLSNVSVHSSRLVKILRSNADLILTSLYYPTPALFTQAALFRRDALEAIGGWDEEVIIDDWALNLKLFENYSKNFIYIDEHVFAYRRHPTNASKRRLRQYKGQVQIVNKYLPYPYRKNVKFSLYARQCLLSVKKMQKWRIKVFLSAALKARPSSYFVLKWFYYEVLRRAI